MLQMEYSFRLHRKDTQYYYNSKALFQISYTEAGARLWSGGCLVLFSFFAEHKHLCRAAACGSYAGRGVGCKPA